MPRWGKLSAKAAVSAEELRRSDSGDGEKKGLVTGISIQFHAAGRYFDQPGLWYPVRCVQRGMFTLRS